MLISSNIQNVLTFVEVDKLVISLQKYEKIFNYGANWPYFLLNDGRNARLVAEMIRRPDITSERRILRINN